MRTFQKSAGLWSVGILFSVTSSVGASNFQPPTGCIEGRTLSDLKVEAANYFAVGEPIRVKGDFPSLQPASKQFGQ